jgi:hypothetical protein
MSAGAYTETAVSEFGICILSFNFQIAGPSQAHRRARCVSWILHGDMLDLEDLSPASGSKIRGEIDGETRNLDSGWPAPVLGNCPVLQNPGRGVESGIWMARAGSWKLVTVPPCVFANRYRSFLFLVSWELGILECGNCDHFTGCASACPVCPVCVPASPGVFLPVLHVCSFLATRKAEQRRKAPGARNGLATAWPERASLQRAPRAARHRVGARSHHRRTG